MRNKVTVGLFLVLIACITACRKNSTTSVYGTYSGIDTIFEMLRLKPKIVTIDAATGGSFYGNSGTRYTIPANALQDSTGNNITGNVQVEVAEYLKKGDMIFSKMLPICDNEPLISGGQISISAVTQSDGRRVYLKPGFKTTAYVPQDGPPLLHMTFFKGIPSQDTSVNRVVWIDSIGSGSVVKHVTNDTLDIISDSLGILNADKFLTNPNYQDFHVKIFISGSVIISSSDKIHIYALYDTVKGVWPINHQLSANEYAESHVPDIKVHFVAFTVINRYFYAGITTATPKTGETYTITLSEIFPEDFKKQINEL